MLAGCSIPTEVAGQAEPVVEAQAMGVAEAPTPTTVVRTGPTAEPTTVVGERVHIVEPGDTLLGIAALYGVSPQAIIAANNLTDPDSIVVGQALTTPPEGAPIPTAAATESAATPTAAPPRNQRQPPRGLQHPGPCRPDL
ncbi:MAG: LysM peptidoglycan-binding domain-containing protein [Anaerolineae bacterium]